MNVETDPSPPVIEGASAAAPAGAPAARSPGIPVVIRIGRRLLREPSLMVTLAYVFVSFIGLWSSYWFYRGFNLPILEYMQAGDYLVAGLRDPVYAILLFTSVAIALLVSWPETHRRDHPERVEEYRRKWWGRLVFSNFRGFRWKGLGMAHETGIVFAVLWGLVAASAAYVDMKAGQIREDRAGARVQVTLTGDAAPQPNAARLLGSSSAFVFLWWPDRKVAEAVPIESIGRLTTVPAVHNKVRPTPAAPSAKAAR
ncbi:hypothetical protein ACFOLC_08855 [Lysobacter cavernae]|uniref:Uncharacterized protein n=1 Tax=Lysobacter cavernae TaxID=1685901 RepID=A0ABV7RSE0_9GAMM